MMESVRVSHLAIDGSGRLVVRPEKGDFTHIYRTASGVHWDEFQQSLIGSKPQEWTIARWFQQIATAVASEYRIKLKVGPWTEWSDVDDETKLDILSPMGATAERQS